MSCLHRKLALEGRQSTPPLVLSNVDEDPAQVADSGEILKNLLHALILCLVNDPAAEGYVGGHAPYSSSLTVKPSSDLRDAPQKIIYNICGQLVRRGRPIFQFEIEGIIETSVRSSNHYIKPIGQACVSPPFGFFKTTGVDDLIE